VNNLGNKISCWVKTCLILCLSLVRSGLESLVETGKFWFAHELTQILVSDVDERSYHPKFVFPGNKRVIRGSALDDSSLT
jgi:hypothetical protein